MILPPRQKKLLLRALEEGFLSIKMVKDFYATNVSVKETLVRFQDSGLIVDNGRAGKFDLNAEKIQEVLAEN